MLDNIKLATRKSPLALKQANIVKNHLIEKGIFKKIEIVPMVTTGDVASKKTFKEDGGKGLFLKELENALINGTADIAVHSMKDVPAKINKIFSITSVMKREDPCDVFISNKHKSLSKISEGQIGSSSPRRQALLNSMGKKLKVIEIRGNINTRLKKLNQSDMDGIILARAGLDRMEMGAVITESLDTDTFVPSPGQGILCIQYLADQKKELKKIKHIVDENTEICACAERIFAASMDGNCMSPIGAYAEINNNEMRLTGFVSKLDGTKYIKNIIVGHKKDYKNLSLKLSKLFISMGSKRMLKC